MITKFNLQLASLVLLFAAVGCNNVDDVGERKIDAISVSHALVQMGSCDDYVAYAKKTAIHRMTAIVERNCREMLDYSNDNSKGVSAGGDGDFATSAPEATADSNGEESSGDFSETNTQEVGVDEADLVKTDGEYIYTISGRDLVVVSIGETGTLMDVGRVSLTGRPQELFLYGDLAVVFSGLSPMDVPESLVLPSPPQVDYGNDFAIERPDVDPMYYDGQYTAIDVIDLSARTAPVVLRSAQYAGSYVSSRRIDGAVRAVLSSPLGALEVPTWVNVDYWDMNRFQAQREINRACDALIESNTEIIDSLTLEELMPMKLEGGDDEAGPIAECTEIYGPRTPAGLGLLTVVSLDLENPLEVQENVAVVGEEGHVYASQTALYLTTSGNYVLTAWESGLWEDETSGIHKFDITSDSGTVTYLGSGEATGRLLNQFSLGEYDEHLRVATTTGSGWWGEANTLDNHIQIFRESGGKLVLTGELSGIGEDEEIYAARFMGTRGFVVTFFETDPLFTFDLSDPKEPKVIGEWLGPGYSTYLHPYGENLLIAMGKDENWRTGVSLYDVSDFANPTLVERQPLVGESYESTALYEHKAFTFNPETGELLLPFYDWDNATGVLKYVITEEDIDLQGTLNMGGDISVEGPARRAMYNADAIIGVSACRLTSAMRSDPSAIISSIPIWDDACEFPNWYY